MVRRSRLRLGAVRATGRVGFGDAGGADRGCAERTGATRTGALRAGALALAFTAFDGRRTAALRAGAFAALRGAFRADRRTLARAVFFAVRFRLAAFREADRPRAALGREAAAFRRLARGALRLAIAGSFRDGSRGYSSYLDSVR